MIMGNFYRQRLWPLQTEGSHEKKGHMIWQSIWRGDFLISHCYPEGWHLLTLASALFFLPHQHKVSQILRTRERVIGGNRERRKWSTTMRKPSWPQFGGHCYWAHKFGANFVCGKSQKWAQMPFLLLHA